MSTNDTPTLTHPQTGVVYEFMPTPGSENDGILLTSNRPNSTENLQMPVRRESLATLVRITTDPHVHQFLIDILNYLDPEEPPQ